LDEQPEGQ
jgi:hypothetical protein